MTTVTCTADTLILEDRPWAFGAFVIFAALLLSALGLVILAAGQPAGGLTLLAGGIATGVLCLWAYVRHVQLWCDRPTNRAALRTRHIFGRRDVDFPLFVLLRCETRTRRSAKGQTLFWPVLVLGGAQPRDLPVFDTFVSRHDADTLCATVNRWLAAT